MEAIINQPLGDVHRLHAFLRLQFVAEDYFVHARRGIWEIVDSFHSLANVVGIEHSVFRGLAQAVGAVSLNVGQSAHKHSEIAVKGAHTAHRLWPIVIESQGAV